MKIVVDFAVMNQEVFVFNFYCIVCMLSLLVYTLMPNLL